MQIWSVLNWLVNQLYRGSVFSSSPLKEKLFYKKFIVKVWCRILDHKIGNLLAKSWAGEPANFGKIFFSPQTKKYKTSKIIVFLIIKTYYFSLRRVTKVQFPYAFNLPAGPRSRLIFSGSGSVYWLFFQAAPAPVFFL